MLGPTSVQALVGAFGPLPTPLPLTLVQAVVAFKIAEKGMSFAG